MARKAKEIAPKAIGGYSDRKYEVQNALRTLTRAEEIRRDSGLMRDVKSHAKEQIKSTERVLGTGKSRGSRKST